MGYGICHMPYAMISRDHLGRLSCRSSPSIINSTGTYKLISSSRARYHGLDTVGSGPYVDPDHLSFSGKSPRTEEV
jgi:hypothetical protein